jgi:outer membrane cobalamin receptor
MRFTALIILFLAMVKLSPAQAQGDNDSLLYSTEEIEVLGNRVKTTIFNSPTAVQVFNRQAIVNSNGENISDVLKNATGVFIKSYGGNVSLQTVSLNGLGAEHTLVLLNGNKMNSFLNAQVDLSLIPKENIERIEVLNNGASAIYGTEAMGGVVNIVTKESLYNNKPDIMLSSQLGSYNTKKVLFSLENSFRNFSFEVISSLEKSDYDFDYYYNTGTQKVLKKRENSGYDMKNIFFDAVYSISSKSRMKLFSSYGDVFRMLPGVEAGTPAASAEQEDRIWNNLLTYESRLSSQWNLKTGLNFQNNLMKYVNAPFTDSYYRNYVISNSIQLDHKRRNMQFSGGYDVYYSTLYSNEHEGAIKRFQPAVFVTSELSFGNFLKVFPSVRYEHISDINESVFSGRFGMNIKPFREADFHIRSSIGNNFHAPTFNELYWENLGNLDLIPEKSVNIDAGFIWFIPFVTENTLTFNYTHIDAKDKIIWTPGQGGYWSPLNIGKSTSNIVSGEIKVSGNLFRRLEITAGASYTYNESIKMNEDYPGDPSLGKQIFYVPVELAKGNISLKYNILSLNVFYNFLGKRYTDLENRKFLPGVDILDGNVSLEMPVWKVSVTTRFEVNNILDADYQVQAGYPMPLRNYKIGLTIKY